jgi:hypothetical protein
MIFSERENKTASFVTQLKRAPASALSGEGEILGTVNDLEL